MVLRPSLGNAEVIDSRNSAILMIGVLLTGRTSARCLVDEIVRLRKRYETLSFDTSPFLISDSSVRMISKMIGIVGRSFGEASKLRRNRSFMDAGHSSLISGRPPSRTEKKNDWI